MQRRLVFTSDARYSLKDFAPATDDRDAPIPPALRFASGNVFGGHLSLSGKPVARPGAGALHAAEVFSLTIRRTREVAGSDGKHGLLKGLLLGVGGRQSAEGARKGDAAGAAEEWGTEELVPSRALEGILPDALLGSGGYQFWRSGPQTLRGYCRQGPAPQGGSAQDADTVVVRWAAGGRDAVVRRLQLGRVMTLVNLAPTGTAAVLQRLASVMTCVDVLGHVLLWSTSRAVVGDECELSRVELPRLRAQFHMASRDAGDGVSQCRLYSQEHDGLFVSDSVALEVRQLAVGMPHALVLRDRKDQSFLFAPNYGVVRPVVFAAARGANRCRPPRDWSAAIRALHAPCTSNEIVRGRPSRPRVAWPFRRAHRAAIHIAPTGDG